MNMNEHLKKM